MNELSLARIDNVLASGAFEQFLGAIEGVEFEAKAAVPYDLSSAVGRYELAKDVSSFANAIGGAVVIGLNTERQPNEDVDVVRRLDLIPRDALDSRQYSGVLRDAVFPEIKGLSVFWHRSASDEDKGLLVLRVPRQADDSKPFLMARVVEDGDKLKQVVFGYASRTGPASEPLSIAQLQQGLRRGLDSNAERFARLEAKVDLLLETRPDIDTTMDMSEAQEAQRRADERMLKALGR